MKKELLHFFRVYSGRRRLTIQEKEAIIDAVLAKTLIGKKRTLRHSLWPPAVARALVIAGLLMAAIPVVVFLAHRTGREDEFVARGADPKAIMAVRCIGARDENTCKTGDTLAFKVRPPRDRHFFSAFSKNQNGGSVIWYYPAKEGDFSVSIPDDGLAAVLENGILIGDEHVPGDYVIYGVFSEQRCRRRDIRQLFDGGNTKKVVGYTIMQTEVRIN